MNAYNFASECFSIETIGELWEDFLRGIVLTHTYDVKAVRDPLRFFRVRDIRARSFSRSINRTIKVSSVIIYTLKAFLEFPFGRTLPREILIFSRRAFKKIAHTARAR